MIVEKFCLKCLHEVFYDTTEHHYCCECFAVRTILDEDGMSSLEYSPPHWIETYTIPKMTAELRALRELREVCGMYCEQLPVEVREALRLTHWIEAVEDDAEPTEADIAHARQLADEAWLAIWPGLDTTIQE